MSIVSSHLTPSLFAKKSNWRSPIMTEKLDIASAARKLKSSNIKTRKRALKAIHDLAKQVKISK